MHDNTALLIVDVQIGMFDESDPVHDGDKLLATLGTLISRARTAGIPIVYVQHEGASRPLHPGSPGWPIHPSIAPTDRDLVIRKRNPDSFQEAVLQQELGARGIRHLVVAGIQTEY
jgi:nicotinamidase-related amidase